MLHGLGYCYFVSSLRPSSFPLHPVEDGGKLADGAGLACCSLVIKSGKRQDFVVLRTGFLCIDTVFPEWEKNSQNCSIKKNAPFVITRISLDRGSIPYISRQLWDYARKKFVLLGVPQFVCPSVNQSAIPTI